MIALPARIALHLAVRAFVGSNDISKITAQQAYDKLYPDHVDLGTFHSVWQHVLSGASDDHLQGAAPVEEVKLEAPQNGSPSSPADAEIQPSSDE
jgi:hypothetical protein